MTEQQQKEPTNEDYCDSLTMVEAGNEEETISESEETIQKRYYRKSRSQEAVTALLASFGNTVEKCSEEFAKQDLTFKDLSVLNRKDLQFLGITNKDKQDEMMETFRMLPNQREHFDNVVESEDAKFNNDLILYRAAKHIDPMEASLNATTWKLRNDPCEDIIIEDRNYASKFVIQAIDEIQKETDEMNERIALLEETIKRKLEIKSNSRVLKKILMPTILIASLSTAVSFAFWFWKSR